MHVAVGQGPDGAVEHDAFASAGDVHHHHPGCDRSEYVLVLKHHSPAGRDCAFAEQLSVILAPVHVAAVVVCLPLLLRPEVRFLSACDGERVVVLVGSYRRGAAAEVLAEIAAQLRELHCAVRVEINGCAEAVLAQSLSHACVDELEEQRLVFELDFSFGGVHVHVHAVRIHLEEEEVCRHCRFGY